MLIDINTYIGHFPFRTLRDNTPEKLVARLDRSNIQMAAVSSIDALFHRHPYSANEKLMRDLEPYPDRLIPIGTLNPLSPHWEDDLQDCLKWNMKGIRIYPPYQGFATNGQEAQRVAKACAQHNIPLFIPNRLEDIRQQHWMDPGKESNLSQIADLIATVPDATIVIPNARGIARSALWQRQDMRNANWYIDLSLAEIFYGLHTNVHAMRDLADVIDEGGANHILFGTNLPLSYAGPALVKHAQLPVDAETLKNISYRTAAKLLQITL
jgi:predicted TIM-barrel fold metal-dependent hydrolase